MKFFISQPMAGLKDSEILEKRNEIIALIKEKYPDAEIIDSFSKSEDIVDRGRVAMLGHSIMLMWDADYVFMCNGWMRSNGCVIENEVASRYNIKRVYEHEFREKKDDTVYWR